MPPQTYTDEAVKEDVRSFFLDAGHWAYQYGTPTPACDPEAPYHRKQIEVIFESAYWHWVTDRAVTALIREGFLSETTRQSPDMRLNFVYRHNLRYMARAMNERAGLVRAYSDQNVSQATGDQAELWSNYIFRANSFSIVGRHTREYQGNEWNQTEHDLDFIIEKDGVAYGVEVKNTFPYIEDDLLDTKLNICAQLGIIPLFVFRQAPLRQMEKVKNQGGIILILRTKVFPLGYERLVKSIWETMRLPVSIWRDFPPKIDKVLQKYHQTVTEQ